MPVILTSYHIIVCLKSSLSPKVNTAKYMPFSLRVVKPTKMPSTKLNKPAIMITTGKGNAESVADVYTPIPKNAAVAIE